MTKENIIFRPNYIHVHRQRIIQELHAVWRNGGEMVNHGIFSSGTRGAPHVHSIYVGLISNRVYDDDRLTSNSVHADSGLISNRVYEDDDDLMEIVD